MNSRKISSLWSLSPSALCALLSGCLAGENQTFFEYASGGNSTGNSEPIDPIGEATPTPTPIVVSTPIPTPTPIVCDPFENGGGGTAGNNTNGVKAKLYYYTDQIRSSHPYHGVNDFLTWGISPNVDFFFSQIHTPTRAFDQGFMMNDGTLVSKEDDTPLFEYFAFKFSGGIQLPIGMENRNVQFAILSDDGAKLTMINPDGNSTLVNNDGDHATKMACGSSPVQVSSTSRLKFELDYYQGPRHHIALTLLWREWSVDSAFEPNDPWCGQSGNSLFFDSTTSPSTPKAPWNDLMNRWQVVPNEVLYVDGTTDSTTTNPCH